MLSQDVTYLEVIAIGLLLHLYRNVSISMCAWGHLVSDSPFPSPQPYPHPPPTTFRELLETIRHILLHSDLGLRKQKDLFQVKARPFPSIKAKLRELEYVEWALQLQHVPVPDSDCEIRSHVQRKGIGAAPFCMTPSSKQDLHPSPAELSAVVVYKSIHSSDMCKPACSAMICYY